MAQGLLLREAGYRCDHGMLYFAASRTRVMVHFTLDLESSTRAYIDAARQAVNRTELPPPLEDSPKCRGCSLNAICLPDETLALQHSPADPTAEITIDGQPARRLYPVRDDATPLYVQEPGARVGTSRGSITITKDKEKLASARLQDTSQLVLCGNIGISTQAIHILAEASIPIVHLSGGHWFYAITHGQSIRNAFDRAAQFDAAKDPAKCLQLAKRLVIDKAANQRTLLRRNTLSGDANVERALREMDDLVESVEQATSLDILRGIEGSIAARYFSQFSKLLKPRDFDATWDFTTRNRRPPTDPVNAMLSLGYSLLAKDMTVALLSEGLDPYWGFYHAPRHGRPALALDLMEPFRAAVVDSAVITAINTGMVSQTSFASSSAACLMQPSGRKSFVRAYESRLDQLITHPVFDYRCSWRIVLRLQARLLSRWLRGDVPVFASVTTR
jgi:CRISPR-associated protein Cas1